MSCTIWTFHSSVLVLRRIMNDLDELLGTLTRVEADPKVVATMGGWDLVDYERSLEESGEVMREKCPFLIDTDSLGLVKVQKVTRNYYIVDGEEIPISKKIKVYDNQDAYDKAIKIKTAKDAIKFFEKHSASYEMYSKFREENPECFI